jgi:TPP-dependent pyruvate/acetoin dehydrogenase alpha subunit
MTMTPADLIAFEADIAAAFNRAEIRSPVHLRSGGEEWLIDYFARNYDATRGDWVCGAWRTHYHCLLAGVSPDEVRAAIMAGRSITLCFPEYRVVSSAIVGGILPIALGLALGIRRRGEEAQVHCFLGDMTAMTGAYAECSR